MLLHRIAIAAAALTAVTLTGCSTAEATSAPPAAATTAPATTAPATTAPAPATTVATRTAPAGCGSLTVGTDGTISPLFCESDTVNPAAVAYYQGGNARGFDPAVLRLPASASRDTVTRTVCTDLAPGSAMGVQTEQQAYELAAQRSDWNYQVNVVDLSC